MKHLCKESIQGGRINLRLRGSELTHDTCPAQGYVCVPTCTTPFTGEPAQKSPGQCRSGREETGRLLPGGAEGALMDQVEESTQGDEMVDLREPETRGTRGSSHGAGCSMMAGIPVKSATYKNNRVVRNNLFPKDTCI